MYMNSILPAHAVTLAPGFVQLAPNLPRGAIAEQIRAWRAGAQLAAIPAGYAGRAPTLAEIEAAAQHIAELWEIDASDELDDAREGLDADRELEALAEWRRVASARPLLVPVLA